MELFKNPNLDFLGKKKIFLTLTAIFMLVSAISLATRGLNYGIDFRGGADVVLRFVQEPAIDEIRACSPLSLCSKTFRPRGATRPVSSLTPNVSNGTPVAGAARWLGPHNS